MNILPASSFRGGVILPKGDIIRGKITPDILDPGD